MRKVCFCMFFVMCIVLNGCARTSVGLKQEPIIFKSPNRKTVLQQFAYTSSSMVMDAQENNCYSPVSLYVTLAMLASGTSSRAQDEILAVLQSDDPIKLYDDMTLLIDHLQNGQNMNMTQSMWLQKDYQISRDWENILEKQFSASLHSVDFTEKETAKKMAKWITKQTNNLIHPSLDLDSDTIFLLLNTIYSKLAWETAFQEEQTYDEPFYLEDGSMKNVSFMHNTLASIPYFDHSTYEGIRLPLQDGSYIYVFLPKETYQLQDLLQENWLSDIQNQANQSYTISIAMPKMQFESKYDLIQACLHMGIYQIFDKAVMKLDPPASLSVYQAEQNVHFQLDEKGVTAAAETHMATKRISITENILEIALNRPFLYVVTTTDQIPLFMGTFQKP